jgi:hypothetical protein
VSPWQYYINYNVFVSKAGVSACMYFQVYVKIRLNLRNPCFRSTLIFLVVFYFVEVNSGSLPPFLELEKMDQLQDLQQIPYKAVFAHDLIAMEQIPESFFLEV